MILPPCVMWLDPGGMTGLAVIEQGRFYVSELGFQQACDQICGYCGHWRGQLWLGWERYDIDVRRPQKDAASAIEVIGVARYFGQAYGCKLLPPAQPATPGRAERERLQALGWWRPGEDDSQSAAAHMLRWLEQTDSAPPWVREATARSGA